MKKIIFVSVASIKKIDCPVFGENSLYNKIYTDGFATGHSSIVEMTPARLVYRYDDSKIFDDQYPLLEEAAVKHDCFIEVVSRSIPEPTAVADAQ